MYGMTNSVKLFSDELTNWLIDKAGFNHQIYVYYKYVTDGSKLVVLSYVYDCVYWYKYEELGKWFVGTPRKIFHVIYLGYAHRFIYIRISQLKDHYISVDKDRYSTYVVANYLDTSTMKEN